VKVHEKSKYFFSTLLSTSQHTEHPRAFDRFFQILFLKIRMKNDELSIIVLTMHAIIGSGKETLLNLALVKETRFNEKTIYISS
jgi:hypothetical protein